MILSVILVACVSAFIGLLIKNTLSVPNRYYPRFGEGIIKYEPLDLQHRPIPRTPITKRSPKVVVIGAGWGGLSAAMLLQARGFDVTVLEKNNHIGGRNAQILVGSCKFDVGPTLLMLKNVCEEIFAESGRNLSDYAKLIKLETFNRVHFANGKKITLYADDQKMKQEIAAVFPGDEKGLDKFNEREDKKMRACYGLLERPIRNAFDCISVDWLASLPSIPFGKSLVDVFANYFTDEECRLAFSFHSKYLGMSAYSCPGIYSMIPYIERKYGVWYAEGGLSSILRGVAKVFIELGGKIHLASSVSSIQIENGAAKGVFLENGDLIEADEVIMNADFGYTLNNLIDEKHLKKWTPTRLNSMEFSCSTFMMYLCLNKRWDSLTCHHNILYPSQVKKNATEVCHTGDFTPTDRNKAMYVCFPGITDPTVCPADKTGLYVLVPTPNLKIMRNDDGWQKLTHPFRETVLTIIEEQLGLVGIRNHIEDEKIITPEDWSSEYNVHYGAVFSLAHTMEQMSFMRPPNQFEVKNTYIVGGNTCPGSGVPTIIESARVVSRIVCNKYAVKY